MKLEYEDLGLAQQVLDRQGNQHLVNMHQFMSQWCTINSGDAGVLMSYLLSLNDLLVDAGNMCFDVVTQAHQLAGEKMQETIDTYAEADEEVHRLISDLAAQMGLDAGPYTDPKTTIPSLGPAIEKAGPYYGGGDPNVFQQAFEDGFSLGTYAREQVDRLGDRANRAFSANRGVVEEQDPSSYLVAPSAPESELENLRWKAGYILGGLDWVFEQIAGWSILNDVVYKNIVGDWRVVRCASMAWKQLDDALVAVGQNDSGVLPALSEWTGKGSEASNAYITTLSAATTALSYAAGSVSGIVKLVSLAAKELAGFIGSQLKKISYRLATIAAEAAIPVAGWVAAAATTVVAIKDTLDDIRAVYKWVNIVYDLISGMIEGKGKLLEVRYTISNLVEAGVRGGLARQ